MVIDKITKLKGNKYKIIIDGEALITYDNVIINNNLLYKREIDLDLYNKIKESTNYFSIYDKTLKYIMKKRRSEKEVREYLTKFDINVNDIDNIIIKLKEINLINDIEYCRAYIYDKVNLSKFGIDKIRSELQEREIPIEIIDQEIDKIDINLFNQKLYKLITKRIKSNTNYSNSYLRNKILKEMISLGYKSADIIEILETNIIDDSQVINKEFQKNYNRLKNKYSGIELNKKLTQKLLLKGFKIEQINEILNKKIKL